VLPLALEAAGNKPVVGIDGAIAAFGTARLVARPLDAEAPLLECGLSVALKAPGRGQSGGDLAGSSAAMNALVTASSIWMPPTLRQ
jgi:hypothetical protein